MFTQCSKCETVFRLSAEVLRAAGGQVRCGRCGEVFNALARLAEEASAFPRGESALELETRADSILQSVESVAPAETQAPAGEEIAQLRIIGVTDADADDEGNEPLDEASLEFTLPPGDLDRIFIESTPSPLQMLASARKALAMSSAVAAAPHPAPQPSAAAEPVPAPETIATSDPIAAAEHPATPEAALPSPARAPTRTPPAAPNGPPPPGLRVSADVVQQMLSGYRTPNPPEVKPSRPRVPFAAWVVGAVSLAVLLIVQLSRGTAEWPAHFPFLGGSNSVNAVSAYQLRQWGVTSDPNSAGTLRVRASIMNVSAQLQPYPLLRVTLADRFGNRVGRREFEPLEYLGKSTAKLLPPSERIDAVLDIRDPGQNAEGFEIDVCVRGADKTVACAADAAPPNK